MFCKSIKPHPARTRATALAYALLANLTLTTVDVFADPPVPNLITIPADQLYGSGSPWFPVIPQQTWLLFEASAPTDTVYVENGAPVGTVQVYAVDPTVAGITLPRGSNPGVFFDLRGEHTTISEPFTITWPNLFEFAPGEAHLIFAYDPQIDRWRVCGAAVVSDDGTVLEQFDSSGNVTLSYYFIDQNTVVTRPPPGS